jgi:hypothetical protein
MAIVDHAPLAPGDIGKVQVVLDQSARRGGIVPRGEVHRAAFEPVFGPDNPAAVMIEQPGRRRERDAGRAGATAGPEAIGGGPVFPLGDEPCRAAAYGCAGSLPWHEPACGRVETDRTGLALPCNQPPCGGLQAGKPFDAALNLRHLTTAHVYDPPPALCICIPRQNPCPVGPERIGCLALMRWHGVIEGQAGRRDGQREVARS